MNFALLGRSVKVSTDQEDYAQVPHLYPTPPSSSE